MPISYGPQDDLRRFQRFNPRAAPVATSNPLANQYKLYETAVGQQAQDYSDLMREYKNLFSGVDPSSMRFTPQIPTYRTSPEFQRSFAGLEELGRTGGYSSEDIANLRARSVSPIRSIYAGAIRDIDRQRALQGGYSPSYNAIRAKLAREMSEQLGSRMTDVEAGLAERVAQNRLSVAPTLTSTALQETGMRTGAEQRAAEMANEAQLRNINLPLQVGEAKLRALEGQRGLYGTTPALTATFGGQALSSAQLQNQINQQNQARNLDIFGQMTRSIPQANIGKPGGLRRVYYGA